MTEIVAQLSDINVSLLLQLYRDFNRIAQILTNQPISTAIAELLKIWQRHQRYLEPICSSAFECIQRLITDEEFRDDVRAKMESCIKWAGKQIVVKTAKELLARCTGFWTSLKEIIKQKLITEKDLKIRIELLMIEGNIGYLRWVVVGLERLITQLEMCGDEDTIKHGQLVKLIEAKLNQVLHDNEKIINIDELKEYILKYQEEQSNANVGLGFFKVASVIGTIATIVNPPSYFLTAIAGGVSTFVVSSLLYSCTADKVEELSQQLTLLEEYKRKYEKTKQEIQVLKDKKEQVEVDKLTNLAARVNLNSNKNDGCACECKCQQV